MGSSMVRMWYDFSSFILSRMAARVEDFPEPVGPVTSTMPLRRSTTSFNTSGRFSSSNPGILSHDVVGNRACVLRTQTLQSFEFELCKLATDLDLRSAARRKNQVTDVRIGLQHGGDELGGVNGPLRWRCRCRRRNLRGRGLRRSGFRGYPHESICVLARPEKRWASRVTSS